MFPLNRPRIGRCKEEMKHSPSSPRFRRFVTALLVVLGIALVRSTAPAPQAASGVTDSVTGEHIGELTYGVTPARLLDTRNSPTVDNQWTNVGARSSGSVITLPVRGRGGVSAGATGAILNVTVTAPSAGGYLTVWPDGANPGTSNLNFNGGETVANLVFVALDSNGNVQISPTLVSPGATAHLIVDVVAFTSDMPTL